MRLLLEAIRMQLPVGQGGLHSTLLRIGRRVFWFAYDCGSSNRSALRRELEGLDDEFGDLPLDMLVLSHLDEDHVNGVERLLSRRAVRRVVIPYLDDDDKVLLLARAAAEDAFTETNVRLYADPDRWFAERGVADVVHVRSARDGDTPPPEAPETPPPEMHDDAPWGFDVLGIVQSEDDVQRAKRAKPSGERALRKGRAAPRIVQLRRFELPAGRPLTIVAGRAASWELVPFWYPPDDIEPFVKKVRRRFKIVGRITTKKLRPILADHAARRDLADLYRTVFSDRNWTSLCVYSGPAFRMHGRGAVDRWHGDRGWLLTGDAPLASRKYRDLFLRYFTMRLPFVDTVVLPHHGSRHSFPRHGLQGVAPDLWVAAAGKNHYGHPDPGLRAALRKLSSFHQVSTRRGSLHLDHFAAYRE